MSTRTIHCTGAMGARRSFFKLRLTGAGSSVRDTVDRAAFSEPSP
jgi:hypothetical protein